MTHSPVCKRLKLSPWAGSDSGVILRLAARHHVSSITGARTRTQRRFSAPVPRAFPGSCLSHSVRRWKHGISVHTMRRRTLTLCQGLAPCQCQLDHFHLRLNPDTDGPTQTASFPARPRIHDSPVSSLQKAYHISQESKVLFRHLLPFKLILRTYPLRCPTMRKPL